MTISTFNGATQIRTGTLPLAALVSGYSIPTANLAQGALFLQSGGSVAMTAPLNLGGQTITNLAAGVNATDGVNLTQVQSMVSGLSDRSEVQYASTSALPANTYANGTAGVGATLTATLPAALVIDGQTPLVGTRVGVFGEAAAANNGIYTVTQVGTAGTSYILTRATDMNSASQFGTGVLVPVKVATGNIAGTANDAKVFMSAAATAFTVGTTAISFTAIGTSYSAGTGLGLAGTTFSVTYGTASGTAAQGNDTRITGALQTSALGASVQTALGVAVGTAGAFVVNGGALGTPSSGTLTNATGLPIAGLTGLGTGVATALAVAAGTAAGFAVLSGGVLTAAEMPALTGDVTNAAGTLGTTVNNTASTGFMKYTNKVINETVGGTINSSNTAFTLANTPATCRGGASSVELMYNGQQLDAGAGNDFTISGTAITMLFAPQTGDKLRANYLV